jgi:ATP-dependent Clp protease ATP-binding subunit ClpX
VGFGADIKPTAERANTNLLPEVLPEDLQKFGLIPEFIGRLPVVGVVDQLGPDALQRILTEPKNALLRQFDRMFELDGVELEFTDEAIAAVVDQALLRKTGARGLRAIIEDVLLGAMYEVPSRENVVRCIVEADAVLKKASPILVERNDERKAS